MPAIHPPEVDLHVHTVASGHAYSTIGEIAREAARLRLRGVAMTDHGPVLPGGPHPYHFMALRFLPPWLHGVRIFRGIEANILENGRIDLEENLVERLDLVLAAFHEECGVDGLGEKENTRMMLAAMENPRVRVIAHPGNPNFPVDFEAVVRQAVATGTALEINNASLSISRKGSEPRCRTLAAICARLGALVSVGSDAHIAQGVGVFGDSLQLMEQAGIDPGQVVNLTLESTLAFLGIDAEETP